ncbi:DNA replication regulator sld2 [Aspergillus terricola var. indicus]
MATVAVSEISTQAAVLRAELKEWERGFAAANGGKKADRGDIKKVPEIAAKYKEYSRLKSQESAPSSKNDKSHSKPVDPQERTRKRKHSSPNGPEHSQSHCQTTSTPRKSAVGTFQTPSKPRTTHPADVDPYDSPSVLRRLFSPSTHMQTSSPLKTAIGPTPQRDGKALGLFDLLSESGGSTATPSATRMASLKGIAAQTPSKKQKKMDTIMEEDEEEEDSPRVERTPASSGKKYMLSALFATPTAWKYSSIVDDGTSRGVVGNNNITNQSPQSARDVDHTNASLETPSFLRRSTSGLTGPDPTDMSPIPVRKPQQFVGKGLSQLVQGLRDMEEERLEDEWDVLREIEIEQTGTGVNVPDSQAVDPNSTGRTFKKKGQKRTTRLVKMRPVVQAKPTTTRSQPQSQSQSVPRSGRNFVSAVGSGEVDELGIDDNDLVAVAETQADGPPAGHDAVTAPFRDDDLDSLHSISETEPDSDSDPDYDADSKLLGRSKSFSEKMKEAIGAAGQDSDAKQVQERQKVKAKEKKEKEKENIDTNAKKPSTRKINPQAHANYRALKIRNRGGGRNFGRFRRR